VFVTVVTVQDSTSSRLLPGSSLTAHPHTEYVYVCGVYENVLVRRSRALVATRRVNCLSLEPSRRQQLASASTDGSVRIWDVRQLSSVTGRWKVLGRWADAIVLAFQGRLRAGVGDLCPGHHRPWPETLAM
jgi:WD40 repeat protein